MGMMSLSPHPCAEGVQCRSLPAPTCWCLSVVKRHPISPLYGRISLVKRHSLSTPVRTHVSLVKRHPLPPLCGFTSLVKRQSLHSCIYGIQCHPLPTPLRWCLSVVKRRPLPTPVLMLERPLVSPGFAWVTSRTSWVLHVSPRYILCKITSKVGTYQTFKSSQHLPLPKRAGSSIPQRRLGSFGGTGLRARTSTNAAFCTMAAHLAAQAATIVEMWHFCLAFFLSCPSKRS